MVTFFWGEGEVLVAADFTHADGWMDGMGNKEQGSFG